MTGNILEIGQAVPNGKVENNKIKTESKRVTFGVNTDENTKKQLDELKSNFETGDEFLKAIISLFEKNDEEKNIDLTLLNQLNKCTKEMYELHFKLVQNKKYEQKISTQESERKIEEILNEIKILNEEYEDLKTEKDTLEKVSDEKIKEITEENLKKEKTLAEKIELLYEENTRVKKENQHMLDMNETTKKLIENIEESLKKADETIENSKKEKEKLITELEALKKEKEKIEKENSKFKEEIADLKIKMAQLTADIKAKDSVIKYIDGEQKEYKKISKSKKEENNSKGLGE